MFLFKRMKIRNFELGLFWNDGEFRGLLDHEHARFREAVAWFPHLHNQYLQIATELGLVGLASLFAIFAALMLGHYRRAGFQSAAVALFDQHQDLFR